MRIGKFYGKLLWALLTFLVATAAYVSLAPETLSTTHMVWVKGLSNAKIVETVVAKPSIEEPVAVEKSEVTRPAMALQPSARLAATTVEPVEPVMREFVVNDVVRALSIVEYPENLIYKTGKLYYAHNTAGLFGDLRYLSVGDKIVVEGRTYTVQESVTYLRSDLSDKQGVLYPKANWMADVMQSAYSHRTGGTHKIALMTCAGRNDAQRLVVYAD